MVFYVALIGLGLAILFGPTLYIQRVMKKHAVPLPEIPGTGKELVEHLLEKFGIHGAKVAPTHAGNHYNPAEKTIYLDRQVYETQSITAVAVAAHEFSHALQDHRKEKLFRFGMAMATLYRYLNMVSSTLFFVISIASLFLKNPAGVALAGILWGLGMALSILVQIVNLPLEWDASFNKAYPILLEGNYVSPEKAQVVKVILRAAALTYLAGALSGLLRMLLLFRGRR